MAALQALRNLAVQPHLTTVDSIRQLVERERGPRPYDVFRMRLCLLSVETFNNGQGIHADFVDEDIASVFTEFQQEFVQVARAQRARFVFRLTVWGPRNGPPMDVAQFNFKPGQVIDMNQVVNLTAWNSLCQGTTDRAQLHLANHQPDQQ